MVSLILHLAGGKVEGIAKYITRGQWFRLQVATRATARDRPYYTTMPVVLVSRIVGAIPCGRPGNLDTFPYCPSYQTCYRFLDILSY
jgi:hypothetical protein